MRAIKPVEKSRSESSGHEPGLRQKAKNIRDIFLFSVQCGGYGATLSVWEYRMSS